MALVDRGGGAPVEACAVLTGLDKPNGIAYDASTGSLFVAEHRAISRWGGVDASALAGCDPALLDGPHGVAGPELLPDAALHGVRHLALGPADGKLYVHVGAPFNFGNCTDPYCTILRLDPDGGDPEVFARGGWSRWGGGGKGEGRCRETGGWWLGEACGRDPPSPLPPLLFAGRHAVPRSCAPAPDARPPPSLLPASCRRRWLSTRCPRLSTFRRLLGAAAGVRNSAAFTFHHPGTGLLVFSGMERDQMGDDIPDDLLGMADPQAPGADFRWPYCHWWDGQTVAVVVMCGRMCILWLYHVRRWGVCVACGRVLTHVCHLWVHHGCRGVCVCGGGGPRVCMCVHATESRPPAPRLRLLGSARLCLPWPPAELAAAAGLA